MKSYNVIFSPFFVQMFEYELNHYITYSSSYARKIEKKVFDDTIQLQYFIDGRQAPKNYFKIYKD